MNLRRILTHASFQRLVAPLTTKQLRLFPLLADLRAYDRAKFNRDGRTAAQVALLAVPQGLALALIAGLPPEHGVFSAIVGGTLGAVFSGGRHVSIGPSVTVAVLLFSTFVQLDISPVERASAVAVLTLLAGLVLVIGAWFRLAALTRYISRSVTTGFITAGGVVLAASQLKHVLGVPAPESGVFVSNLIATLRALPETHWPTLLVASLTAGAYLALHLKLRGAPAAVLAVAVGAAAGWLLAWGGEPTARLQPMELYPIPHFSARWQWSWTGMIANAALATALIAQLEMSLVGRSLAARAGDRFDANQHMFGLGAGFLGCALCSALPPSESLSRARLIRRLGAATPMVGVLSGLYAGAIFFCVAPYIHHVPRAALAALAIVLATEIVSRHYLRVILRSSRDDAVVLVATVAAGLLFRLDAALYFGAGLSIVFFLRRVGVPELSEYGFTQEGQLAVMEKKAERAMPDISIVHVEGDLFFGAAEIFLDQARRVWEDPNLKIVILRMKNAHHLDATSALAIEELLKFARDHGRHIIVAGAHREIYRVFRNSGLLEVLGRENFFMDVPSNPTVSTRNALKRAQQLLGGQRANIRIYVDPAKKSPGAATATTT